MGGASSDRPGKRATNVNTPHYISRGRRRERRGDPPFVSESTSTRFSACFGPSGGVRSGDLECVLQAMGISPTVTTCLATTGGGSTRKHLPSVDLAHESLGYGSPCKLWDLSDILVFGSARSSEVESGSWPAQEQFVASL